jgi:TonB-linked SusC/RagA family outer membrane protein
MSRRVLGKALATMICLLLIPFLLLAQSRTLVGTVTDDKGNPVVGASVTSLSSNTGVATDEQGKFSIVVPAGSTLRITAVNYESIEIKVDQRTDYSITIKASNETMEDVVVVGYATQKKVNLTGSVATVSSKDLQDRPIVNVSTAISGLVPGVFVRQGSGDPRGSSAQVSIRGLGTLSSNNSPLVVIDGIIGNLDAVNPQDIETISVLKDAASASIYGTLAANGVILVTTKKGSRKGTTVSYQGNMSISQPMNKPKFITDYPTYMRTINEGYENVGQNKPYTDRTIAVWDSTSQIPNQLNPIGVPNYVAYPNTNWSDVLFENKIVQNHNISINGGSEKVGYLLSAGFLNNPGNVDRTDLKRYQLRMNLDAKINKFLTLGTQTFASSEQFGLGNVNQAFQYLRETTPGIYPVWDGRYGFPAAPEENQNVNNVLSWLNNQNGNSLTSRFNTTLYATVTFFKGFAYEGRVNYQMRQNEFNQHPNASASEAWDFGNNIQRKFMPTLTSINTQYSYDKDKQVTYDNVLRFTTTVGQDHDLGALAGFNQMYSESYNLNSVKTGLIDYNITTPSSALTPTTISGDRFNLAVRSYFGRVNYSYKGRYLLEGNLRYDGVSRFSPETRWGLFPSVSAGWRISDESFMKGILGWMSNLKLRASWGKLGNNASGFYDWQATYAARNYSFNNAQVSALAIGRYANPNLQWETTKQVNLGLDAGFFNNKLNLELDIYRKLTDGILTTTPIALTAGSISAPIVNAAEVMTKGVDVLLGYRTRIGAVDINISGNVAYNRNEVTKYKGRLREGFETDGSGNSVYKSNLGDVSSGGDTRILEGRMINEYYLLQVYQGSGSAFNGDGSVNINGGPRDGIIRTETDLEWAQAMLAAGYKLLPSNSVRKDAIWFGDLIYADLNGDGSYGNSFDRKFSGTSSLPKFVFGANFEFLLTKDLIFR